MNSKLLALKITGRLAAAAVYFGHELHYVQVRTLLSDASAATDSLVSFLSSLIEHFHIDSAGFEEVAHENKAMLLSNIATALLKERSIPHWSVSKADLLIAYSETPLTTTSELRQTVRQYWPHIISERDDLTCLDAAAVGLYLQTERMLSHHSSSSP